MSIKNLEKNIAYQGEESCIFRKILLNHLSSISEYRYDFYLNHDDDYFKNKTLDFITVVALGSYLKVVLFLKKNFIIISEFENESIKGIHFKNKSNLEGMIFIPQESTIIKDSSIINRDIFSFTLSELISIKEKNNLYFLNDFEKFPIELYYGSLISSLAFQLNITVQDFLILLYENSLNEYIKYFNIYKKGRFTSDDLFIKKNRTHIEIFSFFFYWTIKIAGDVLPYKEEGYSFHDVGTEIAFLPAMLLKLNRNELMNLNINKVTASDYIPPSPELEEWIKIHIDNSKYIKFNFNNLNLTDLNMKYPESDITAVIDVIEHLPDEKSALKAVLKLWDHTEKILIIHVPFETEQNKWHDHNMMFNAEKLRKWASYFKGGRFLSDSYKDGKNNLLTDFGFLIIQKI